MIYVPRQAHGLETKASRKMSATSPHYQGRQCLNIHLLKPARVWAADSDIATAEAPSNQPVGFDPQSLPARGRQFGA